MSRPQRHANTQTAAVTVRLLDSAGQAAQTATITLQPFASTSKFLKELFPGLSSFQGAVQMQSNVPVAALGLRFTGTIFTTFPAAVLH